MHNCQCGEGLISDCGDDEKNMEIEYYGDCKELAPCPDAVLIDFPRRMREWLSQVMK